MEQALPGLSSSATDPAWYFESQSLTWWLSNLFDKPVEVHAFELGLLVGVLFGVLAAGHHLKTLGVVVLSVLAFLVGTLDPSFLCEPRTVTCAHVQLKPWYFLSGAVLAQLGSQGLLSAIPGVGVAATGGTARNDQ